MNLIKISCFYIPYLANSMWKNVWDQYQKKTKILFQAKLHAKIL